MIVKPCAVAPVLVALDPASDEIEIPLPVVVMLLFVIAIPALVDDTEMLPQTFWLIAANEPLLTEMVLLGLRVLLDTVAATKAVDAPPTEIPCANEPPVTVLFVAVTVVADVKLAPL